MKKIIRFFSSMKFGLILLGILLAACVAGSVIPQGEMASYYMSEYSQSAGGAILALGLDDVFHCPWFIVLTVVLCINLIACSISRFPSLLKRTRTGFTAEKYLRAYSRSSGIIGDRSKNGSDTVSGNIITRDPGNVSDGTFCNGSALISSRGTDSVSGSSSDSTPAIDYNSGSDNTSGSGSDISFGSSSDSPSGGSPDGSFGNVSGNTSSNVSSAISGNSPSGAKELLKTIDPETLFKNCGFHKITKGQTESGQSYLYAVKNKAGIWGAWLCHLGMLIVIIGFGLGQMKQVQYAVYGVAGQTKPVENTRYELTIDDFDIALREDDTVEQYTASITMTNTQTGETQSGQTSVNHPCTLFGMRCYQNSTGWAATVQIWKDDKMIQEDVLCAGEYVNVEDKEGLAVMFSSFYPDYDVNEEGLPVTVSSRLNNPAYLYRLYYQNEILGMNVLKANEAITVDAYTILFLNPQSYTLIQIKRDPYTPLAAVGAVLVMIALTLAFYLRTAEVFAIRQEDGSWSVTGYSRKGGEEFTDLLIKKNEEMEGGAKSR